MRHSSIRILTGVSSILFGAAALHLVQNSVADFSVQAQTTSPASVAQNAAPAAKLHPVSAPISTAGVKLATSTGIPAPDIASGSEIYTTKRGDTLPSVARQYLHKTSYLTSSELADAIRAANPKTSATLKANENIVIPAILPAPIVEHNVPVARDFEARAIYLTGIMAASDHGLRIIRHWREVGGNAVVFDIKDSDGSVTIPFEHPLLGKHQVYIHDLPKFIHFVHSQNMHAIARIAIFRDERLVKQHPELAVQSRKTGQPWRENGKLVWTDSSNPTVQDYNITLAKFVAQSGADEIQFDYVRFPAEGDQKDAKFAFQSEQAETPSDPCTDSTRANVATDALVPPAPAKPSGTSPITEATNTPAAKRRNIAAHSTSRGTAGCKLAQPGPQRSDVITAFLKKAYAELHPTGALLSLDVFGVMAWQRQVDLSHTGQDIVGMAKYCDVLSPMIYPSHFFGMDGIAHPGDAPEHFIGESMARFELITHPVGNKSRGNKSDGNSSDANKSGVVIRPWLQAFRWRTKTYSADYIKVQVATAKEKGGIGFLFWNAANDYSRPYEAMPEMRASDQKQGATATPKYFRGDELPSTTVRAALAPDENIH